MCIYFLLHVADLTSFLGGYKKWMTLDKALPTQNKKEKTVYPKVNIPYERVCLRISLKPLVRGPPPQKLLAHNQSGKG